MDPGTFDTRCQIASLHVYPVKGCRGIDLDVSDVRTEGLAFDREWMLVDEQGRFLTQRELPSLARVHTAFEADHLRLDAPGHSPLQVALAPGEGPRVPATVWRFQTLAQDCGGEAARWFRSVLGRSARLVRFPPDARRECNVHFAGTSGAHTKFSDGYPILVLGQASIDDLAARMGLATLAANRFRANVILAGLAPYEEDSVRVLAAPGLQLQLVKPCTRCTVPDVDQGTGEVTGPSPLATLTQYRMAPALGGAVLGVNAIVTAGAGGALRKGQELGADFGFA